MTEYLHKRPGGAGIGAPVTCGDIGGPEEEEVDVTGPVEVASGTAIFLLLRSIGWRGRIASSVTLRWQQ